MTQLSLRNFCSCVSSLTHMPLSNFSKTHRFTKVDLGLPWDLYARRHVCNISPKKVLSPKWAANIMIQVIYSCCFVHETFCWATCAIIKFNYCQSVIAMFDGIFNLPGKAWDFTNCLLFCFWWAINCTKFFAIPMYSHYFMGRL